MNQIHVRLGFALLLVLLAGIVLTLLSLRKPQLRPTVHSYLRLCEAASALQALGGAFLILGGLHPNSAMHWLYGGLTVGALPLAERVGSKSSIRMQSRWLIGGALATFLFAARAATTG